MTQPTSAPQPMAQRFGKFGGNRIEDARNEAREGKQGWTQVRL